MANRILKLKSKLFIIVGTIVFGIILILSVVIYRYSQESNRYIDENLSEATPVALAKANTECIEEGLSSDICSNLLSVPSEETHRCGMEICWLIYVYAQDKEIYFANIFVAEDSEGNMRAVDYSRNYYKKSQ